MKRFVFLFFFIVTASSWAQHDFHNTEKKVVSSTHLTKLVDYFKKGHLSGQIRNFTMVTVNQGALSNYHANAIGASIHFETLPLKGFSIGLNGLFVYRLFSNDLLEADEISGSTSNYELQLFDVEHKGNYNDLDRLEELYLKYEYKNLTLFGGKMEIETPLVNMHDGRMKPKVFSGLKGDLKLKHTDFTTAWFNKASPRSTTHWYKIEEAIGLYNNGTLPDGSAAHYHEHLSSKGLGILGIENNKVKNTTVSIWNYYLDNISNTGMIKADIDLDSSFYGGFIYLNQTPINKGGANESMHTYYNSEEQTNAFSARLGYHFNWADIQVNATHITASGKFIFPREFGVDPFYTFISRSQIEGLGNSSALGITGIKRIKSFEINCHWNRMLTTSNLRLNKYNLPSYDQFNLDLTYHFHKHLEGLDLRFLYVYRRAIDRDLSLDQMHNTVNFNQLNLIANFNF